MNEQRDLQHPEITEAHRTGQSWFPKRIYVDVSERDAMAYCNDNFSAFWDFLLAAYPYAITGFMDDNADDYIIWKEG